MAATAAADPAARSPSTMTWRWPVSLVAGAALVAVAARVTVPVPGSPVPMSLQGPAVLLVGGLFGAACGAGAMLLYLVAGALGAPVFAAGASGLPQLIGPTGGYLLAFPVAAAVTGLVAIRRKLSRCFGAALLGMMAIHIGGWAGLYLQGNGIRTAFAEGLVPFLVVDGIKILGASLVLWLGHDSLRPKA